MEKSGSFKVEHLMIHSMNYQIHIRAISKRFFPGGFKEALNEAFKCLIRELFNALIPGAF